MIIHSNKINDSKNPLLCISAETNEDIYRIYNLLNIDDIVIAYSNRKIKLENGTIFRKSANFEIKIEKIDIDISSGLLDIKGKILNQIDNVKSHSFHTLNIIKNEKITILKDDWDFMALKILKEMKTKIHEMIFFIKRINFVFILSVTENNIKQIDKFDIKKPKSIKESLNKINFKDSLIIVSVNTKDSIDSIKKLIEIKDKSVLNKYIFINLQYNIESLNELINHCLLTPNISNRLNEVQFINGFKQMELFLNLFNSSYEEKRALVCVGFSELQLAFDYSAIKTLLISSDLYKSCNLEERKKIEQIEKLSEGMNIKLFILPINHNFGNKLKEMGGIAAILNFPINDF